MGTLESFPTIDKAQKYINDEMETCGFSPDEVEVVKGYYLKKRDVQAVVLYDEPERP